jgi:hypothetical protein
MGRIGRSYPRFEAPESSAEATPQEGGLAFQLAGAVIGILAALGLIGWIFAR